MQVGKQGMHSGSPWSGGTANGVPDANDTITDVATGQGLFIIVPHRTSVSDRLVMITPLRGTDKGGTEVEEQGECLFLIPVGAFRERAKICRQARA